MTTNPVFDTVAVNGVITAPSLPFLSPINYGKITDGGHFGDGLSHHASSNGYSTLATLQTQFQAASFTATGSGTNLTVSSVTGYLYRGLTLGVTTGISAGTKIVSQTSGTPGGAGVYVTSAATTISSGAATASWASTTSDDMAGLMIQAAIHAGNLAGGAEITLLSGSYYNIACGLLFPTASAVLKGRGSILLCSPTIAAGNPGVSILLAQGAPMPITGIALYGFDTFVSAPGTGGTPNTGLYTAGSIAMYHVNCIATTLSNMTFNNFDECHYWEASPGNNYAVTIRDCTYSCNNSAAVIDQPSAANSFERMTWENCTIGSNNYGALINMAGTRAGGFGGTSLEGTVYFRGCSIDYSNVAAIWFNGGASTGDNQGAIYCSECYFETNVTTSGNGARVFNNGAMHFVCCEIYENGFNPNGFLSPLNLSCAQSFVACKAPGFSTGPAGNAFAGVPLVMGDLNLHTQGYANTGRGNGGAFLTNEGGTGWTGAIGQFASSGAQPPSAYVINYTPADVGFGFPIDRDILIIVNGTIKVNSDSTANWATGSVLSFVTVPGVFSSFTANGVTITTSNTALTFGHATKPKHVHVMKTGANAWVAYGDMD